MRFSSVAFSAFLLALAIPSRSQNATFLAELVSELESAGLTSLVGLAASLNGTTQGDALLNQIGAYPQTIFAPNNDAFSAAANLTSNPELVADRFAYHIVSGTFNVTQNYPNTTIGRTLLNDSSLVFLEGHKNQVVAWANIDNTTRILNQNTIVEVLNTTTVGNVTLKIIDAVIDFPGEFTAAITANNLTAFSSALSSAGLLNPINTLHGVTIFAPTDDAFAAAQQNLTAAGSNSTLLNIILENHIINGSTIYSGDFQGHSSSLTTGSGESLSSTFNSSGGFITIGNVTAKIVTPDIVLWNGVLHIVDHVLLNEQSNSGAASSAASSAAVAATSATSIETGPIGFTPSPTSTTAGGSGSGSSSSSAAGVAAQIPFIDFGLASIFATTGVMLGALLIV